MSLFQLKQSLVDPVDLHGVATVKFGPQNIFFISTYLTRLDQALMTWGVVVGVIFLVAQFHVLDWYTQSIVWSGLSCLAIGLSSKLTWFWVTTRNQRWILYGWSILVLVGLGLTDYGIFRGMGFIVGNLCALWLGLSGFGYVLTGVGMQARALVFIGLVHVCAIPGLALLPMHQFLLTGMVMSVSLFVLAIFHWDHH